MTTDLLRLLRFELLDRRNSGRVACDILMGRAADEIEDLNGRLTRINDNWPHVLEVEQLRRDLAIQAVNAKALVDEQTKRRQAELERDVAVEDVARLLAENRYLRDQTGLPVDVSAPRE